MRIKCALTQRQGRSQGCKVQVKIWYWQHWQRLQSLTILYETATDCHCQCEWLWRYGYLLPLPHSALTALILYLLIVSHWRDWCHLNVLHNSSIVIMGAMTRLSKLPANCSFLFITSYYNNTWGKLLQSTFIGIRLIRLTTTVVVVRLGIRDGNGSSFVTHDPWPLHHFILRMGLEGSVAWWYLTTLSVLRTKNRRPRLKLSLQL